MNDEMNSAISWAVDALKEIGGEHYRNRSLQHSSNGGSRRGRLLLRRGSDVRSLYSYQ